MQHDNTDDPYGFWNDQPIRQIRRTHVGARSHGDPGETRLVPVVRTRDDRIPATHQRNPLMTRVCVMVGAGLLIVPIGMGLNDAKSPASAQKLKSVAPLIIGTMPPPPTDLVPETEAPTTTLATTTSAAAATLAPTTSQTVVVTAPSTEPPTVPPTTPAPKKKVPAKPAPATTAAPAAQVAATPSCAATYTVVAGDAWSSIASRAKVSMNSLLAANNATVSTVLLPGKKICLPDGAVQPGPPSTKPPTTNPPATSAPPTTAAPKPTNPPATTQPPTTVTTAPGTTQPAPPPNTYTKAQVAQIIRDIWPDDLENAAIAIATRESNLIPTVRNYCCYGLFQIYFNANKTFLASIGVTSAAQLYDPVVNTTAAYKMYQVSGWKPWGGDPTATTTTVSG